MNADWMFDHTGVATEWNGLARAAVSALDEARAALERADADRLTNGDRRAIADALVSLAETRARLRELDAGLLGDAEKLLGLVLKQTGPTSSATPSRRIPSPLHRVATQHAQPADR